MLRILGENQLIKFNNLILNLFFLFFSFYLLAVSRNYRLISKNINQMSCYYNQLNLTSCNCQNPMGLPLKILLKIVYYESEQNRNIVIARYFRVRMLEFLQFLRRMVATAHSYVENIFLLLKSIIDPTVQAILFWLGSFSSTSKMLSMSFLFLGLHFYMILFRLLLWNTSLAEESLLLQIISWFCCGIAFKTGFFLNILQNVALMILFANIIIKYIYTQLILIFNIIVQFVSQINYFKIIQILFIYLYKTFVICSNHGNNQLQIRIIEIFIKRQYQRMSNQSQTLKEKILSTSICANDDDAKQGALSYSTDPDDHIQFENGIDSENRKLKNQILDLQIKERSYITKILNLQTIIAKMNLEQSSKKNNKRSSIDACFKKNFENFTIASNQVKKQQKKQQKDQASQEQKRFCQVMIKTYDDLFQIISLKQIWKKHKEILGQWMFSDNSQQ